MKMLISKLNLNESFICSIWENQEYYSGLKTTNGEDVEVLEYGEKNFDAGPDYVNARISIDGRIFTGSVEIHRECGDWHRHSHRNDSKYAEVVLHVALFNDSPEEGPAKVKKAREIPTVILSNHLSRSIREIWKEIITNKNDNLSLPCFPSALKVPSSIKRRLISELSYQRQTIKSEKIAVRIEKISETTTTEEAMEEALFEDTCEALGYSKNKSQFLRLARNLNIGFVKKKNLSLIECDSIVFGMSGFLQSIRYKDRYIDDLRSKWEVYRTEMNLPQMNSGEWNFFRLRPVNFPTLRLAYSSGLLHFMTQNNLSAIVNDALLNSEDPYRRLSSLLTGICVSDYWHAHYHFGRKKKSPSQLLGDQRIADIIVNVLIPFGLYANREVQGARERIFEIYSSLKQTGGKSVLTRWLESETGITARSLSDEQGLIQLYKELCSLKKCSECKIGREVFSEKTADEPLRIIMY